MMRGALLPLTKHDVRSMVLMLSGRPSITAILLAVILAVVFPAFFSLQFFRSASEMTWTPTGFTSMGVLPIHQGDGLYTQYEFDSEQLQTLVPPSAPATVSIDPRRIRWIQVNNESGRRIQVRKFFWPTEGSQYSFLDPLSRPGPASDSARFSEYWPEQPHEVGHLYRATYTDRKFGWTGRSTMTLLNDSRSIAFSSYVSVGWPFRSFDCHRTLIVSMSDRIAPPQLSAQGGAGHQRSWFSHNSYHAGLHPLGRFVVPLSPQPLWLILNTISYLVIYRIANYSWRHFRARSREKHKSCPSCGYNWDLLQHCPECGYARNNQL